MLTRLEVLDSYVVRNEKDYIGGYYDSSRIEELAGLNTLRELTITHLHNVIGKMDAEGAKLKDKMIIKKLYLKWVQKRKEEEEVADSSFMVLEGLKPHSNLELLSIEYFGGVKLPKWMSSSYCLPNLVKLFFKDCKSCEKLQSLGMLRCLCILHMIGMSSVKCLGVEFYYQQGEEEESSMTTLFPSLIELRIHYLNDLEEWVAPPPPYSSFPVLEYLSIQRCPKLKSIPDLGLRTSLQRKILECNKLEESMPCDPKNPSCLEFLDELSRGNFIDFNDPKNGVPSDLEKRKEVGDRCAPM